MRMHIHAVSCEVGLVLYCGVGFCGDVGVFGGDGCGEGGTFVVTWLVCLLLVCEDLDRE